MILLKSLLYEQITPTKQLNVLFIGDSQTASPYSYANQLIKADIVTGDIVAKGGISMKSMLELFKLNYEPGKYDAISILGGNNDAGSTRFDQTSFKTIINIANQHNTPVIIVTAPTMRFINKQYYPSKYPSQDSIPAWQKSLESENVSIVDAYGLLDNPSNFIEDGLHLTKNSQKLIMKAWTQVIKNIEPTIDDSKLITDLKTEGSLRYGDIGDDVKEMQEHLIDLNYSVGPEANDGIFGPHTRDGVKAFQMVNKLTVDGIYTDVIATLIKNGKALRCTDSIRQQLDKKITSSNPITIIPIANENQSVEKQAFALIAKFERFEPTPYVDNDGIYRIGYGSSTITHEDGTIKKMGYKKTADVITQEDATRDLNRRIEDEFLPRVLSTIRKWGQEPTKFNDATLAVLTSICYNYGSLDNKSTRPTLQPHIQSGDATALANAISELRANKRRRRQEADYILNSLDNPNVKKGTTGIEKSADNTKSKPSVLKPNNKSKKDSAVLKNTPKKSETNQGGVLDNIINTIKLAPLAIPFVATGDTLKFASVVKQDIDNSVVNTNLINDIETAAKNAGVTVTIALAKTGHARKTKSGYDSRHWTGKAVDISEINGANWNSKAHAIQLGVYDAAEAFVAELQKMGYLRNNEYNQDKAVLSFGFPDHDNHIHVSRIS